MAVVGPGTEAEVQGQGAGDAGDDSCGDEATVGGFIVTAAVG